MTTEPNERDSAAETRRGPDPRLRTMTEEELRAESVERAAQRDAPAPTDQPFKLFTR